MKNKSLMCAATMSVALMSFNAQAGLIEIDGFDVGTEQTLVLTGTGATATDTNAVRTLSATLLASTNPVSSSVEVSFGSLTVTNGSGEDSVVRVSWAFDASALPVNSNNYEFLFKVIESDGNPTSLDFFYNSLAVASFSVPGNTLNQDLSFAVAASSLATSGTLELVINGTPGWDLQVDAIGLSYDVPEPATLGLFALGLLGVAAGARRRA